MALELALCVEAVDRLHFIWENSDDEDRRGFVHNLFEWVEYDLDARRITNFRLKPWADRFIILRGALYAEEAQGEVDGDLDDDDGSVEGKKELASPNQEVKQAVPHRGFEPAACFDIWQATFYVMEELYDTPFPTGPQTDLVPAKTARNAEIRIRYKRGETMNNLARTFGISEQRVSQIVHERRN
jgi:hypothetical protein